jgi:hypothetical protein
MLFDRRALRHIVASLIASWLVLAASAVHAVAVTDLYEVTLPIQGTREAAFSEALKQVAVRVSGRRDAGVRIGSTANVRQYVQRFSFTADNQLQVAFHAGSVDRLLSEAGLPVWGRERPLTLVLLNAPLGDAGSMWIESNYPAAEREALERAAQTRGVPLAWPLLDSQTRSLLDAGDGAELLSLAARHNANAVLVGRGRRDPAGQLVVHWTLRSDEGAAEVTGSLEDGAHLIGDTFGRIYAASADSLETITAEVAGIRNLDDYATTLSYLEGMTLVRNVALETVSGDTMRFRLAVRGDATALRRALALDNKLLPAGDESAADRLQLRLQR